MNSPIQIKVAADVRFVDTADNTPCPDFSQQAANSSAQNTFTVEVVDALSQEPIRQARVRVFEQGRLQRDVKTDRLGVYAEAIPIGYYYVHAASEGYVPADTTGYINRRNNYIRIELMPVEPTTLVQDVESAQPDAPTPDIEIVIDSVPDAISQDARDSVSTETAVATDLASPKI